MLESELVKFRLELTATHKSALSLYCDELARWNRKINLTGLQGADMVRRLVIEPVWIARHVHFSGVLVDIGSGNGSPAIPIHVVSNLERCHLVEARSKRAVFLRHVVALLKDSNIVVHKARFEDVAPSLEKADWITLQAVRLTPEVIEFIRKICIRTTTIVWITSPGNKSSLEPARILEIPLTGTKVFLFHLDLP